MTATEQAFTFDCAGETLVGILSLPPSSTALDAVGVVIVVGGPQYRIGSHRQFVTLARRLARAGHPVLRFDYRGMGDSPGPLRSFEACSDDIAAAIDAFHARVPGLGGVALWGLCDGASASLLYLERERRDSRVRGLCLVNPWVRSAASLARTHVRHYYRQRLLQPAFWRKLCRGEVAGAAWRGLLANLKLAQTGAGRDAEPVATFQSRMASAFATFAGPTLLLLSGDDYTAREFVEFAAADARWTQALARDSVERVDLPGVDHTFSTSEAHRSVEDRTLAWLDSVANRRHGVPPAGERPAPRVLTMTTP